MRDTFLCPYLAFDGDCRQAMEFYRECLGGTLVMQTFGEAPVNAPEDQKDRIMHAMLDHDLFTIMASDTMPGMEFTKGTNVTLSLVGTDSAWLRACFEKLSAGGKVTMPLEKQFWCDVFGTLTDTFGIHWMVNIGEKK
mgnify:CR=1 FL=1